MKLSPEERIVLLLLQPFPSALVMQEVQTLLSNISRPVNYDRLIQLANMNQVTPLLYKNLSTIQIVPRAIIQLLQTHYIMTIQRNAAHLKETLQLINILSRAGISSIPLKGSFAAETLLGDMGLYPTSDLDLLVRWGDLKKARDILITNGYEISSVISEQDQLAGSYHLYFHKEATVLELHWNLVMRYFSVDPDYWWKDLTTTEYQGQKILQLSQERYLLYLVFRLFSHGFLPLRFFMLPLGIVSRQANAFDWDKFMQYARELKMGRLANFTANIFHDIFSVEIPEPVERSRMIGYDVLKNKVMAGVFNPPINSRLRMLMLLVLLDSPLNILRVLLRRLFPHPAEIRLRYNLPHGSLKLLPYYLFNPLIMLFKSIKR